MKGAKPDDFVYQPNYNMDRDYGDAAPPINALELKQIRTKKGVVYGYDPTTMYVYEMEGRTQGKKMGFMENGKIRFDKA